MGLYNEDGAIRVTVADENSRGLYAPDGSWYVNVDSGNKGLYGPNGCLNAQTWNGETTLYNPDGGYYVNGDTLMVGYNLNMGYSVEAQALFARFTTPPTAARKTLINDLIVSLKDAGVWSKLDALYVMAAADAQAARQNWVADQYNLTAVSSPTFTADRGYQGDGAASYLNMNFNPSTAGGNFVQDNAGFGFWSLTNLASNTAQDIGNAANVTLTRSSTDGHIIRANNTGTASDFPATVTDSRGYFYAGRASAAAERARRNTSQIGTNNVASTALSNSVFTCLGRNTATAPTVTVTYSTRQLAIVFAGANLTDGESDDAYAAFLSYLQAVGAVA